MLFTLSYYYYSYCYFFYVCILYPKSSLSKSLRQGARTGLRSAIIFSLPTEIYRVYLIFVTNNCCAFLDVRHHPSFHSVSTSAFSVCFCNPSGVSDVPTKSSAYINPDTVYSPAVTPCLAVSTATIRSLIYRYI